MATVHDSARNAWIPTSEASMVRDVPVCAMLASDLSKYAGPVCFKTQVLQRHIYIEIPALDNQMPLILIPSSSLSFDSHLDTASIWSFASHLPLYHHSYLSCSLATPIGKCLTTSSLVSVGRLVPFQRQGRFQRLHLHNHHPQHHHRHRWQPLDHGQVGSGPACLGVRQLSLRRDGIVKVALRVYDDAHLVEG